MEDKMGIDGITQQLKPSWKEKEQPSLEEFIA